MGWYRDGTRKVEGKGEGVGLNGCEAGGNGWQTPPNQVPIPSSSIFSLVCFLFLFFFTHLTLGFGIFLVGKGEGIGMDGW